MNSESLHDTAYNPLAPAGERRDAGVELTRAYMPTASELIPAPDVQEVVDYINDLYAEQTLHKAQVIQFPGAHQRRDQGKSGPRSVFIDPYTLRAFGDYFDRPSLAFEWMRRVVAETPLLGAVVFTRVRQVQRFCSPQEDDGPGFTIRHLDREHQATKSDQERIKELIRVVNNCGTELNPRLRRKLGRDSFPRFVGKLARDSLVLDSAPIETERSRGGRRDIVGVYALDGATIRLCTEEGYQGDDRFFAVQVVEGNIVTAYTIDDLIYEPRNESTEINRTGYGVSEVELLIKVVSGFLNAMNLNLRGFTDNSIPKGVLHLIGDYDAKDLTAFKRYMSAMVKGVQNAWAMPVMATKDPAAKASFERFGVDFNEMYFGKWMTFLTSLICALYGMSPAEINFDSFTGGNTSSLSGSDTAEKIAASKDSGLRPLMSYLEGVFSDFVVSDLDERMVFRWAGLEPTDLEKRHELRKLILTIDELRAEEGYAAMNDKQLGAAPANPSLVGPWMQIAGIGVGAPGAPGEGEEGAPGEGEEGAPGEGEEGAPGEGEEGATDEDDQAILDEYFRMRQEQEQGGSLAKSQPVFVVDV